jgi:hypothetical protein
MRQWLDLIENATKRLWYRAEWHETPDRSFGRIPRFLGDKNEAMAEADSNIPPTPFLSVWELRLSNPFSINDEYIDVKQLKKAGFPWELIKERLGANPHRIEWRRDGEEFHIEDIDEMREDEIDDVYAFSSQVLFDDSVIDFLRRRGHDGFVYFDMGYDEPFECAIPFDLSRCKLVGVINGDGTPIETTKSGPLF